MTEVGEMRAWSTDAHGRRIRVGLTAEETAEYAALFRSQDYAERDRWLDLHGKHVRARIAVIMAESEAKVTRPQKH